MKNKMIALIAVFVALLVISGCGSKVQKSVNSDTTQIADQSKVSDDMNDVNTLNSETSMADSESFGSDLNDFENFGK